MWMICWCCNKYSFKVKSLLELDVSRRQCQALSASDHFEPTQRRGRGRREVSSVWERRGSLLEGSLELRGRSQRKRLREGTRSLWRKFLSPSESSRKWRKVVHFQRRMLSTLTTLSLYFKIKTLSPPWRDQWGNNQTEGFMISAKIPKAPLFGWLTPRRLPTSLLPQDSL